jgi:hypothetical protein
VLELGADACVRARVHRLVLDGDAVCRWILVMVDKELWPKGIMSLILRFFFFEGTIIPR